MQAWGRAAPAAPAAGTPWTALALVVFASSALAAAERRDLTGYDFEAYVREFSKTYATQGERLERRTIFQHNLDRIRQHNSDPQKTWWMAVNQFTDLTNDEFSRHYTGRKGADHRDDKSGGASHIAAPWFNTPVSELPPSVDWRKHPGVVTPPKNQGRCGSCWAFSATEALESAAAIASGQPAPVLSPQQLVSCSPNPKHCGGTGGCEGSTQELAFQYVQTAGLSLASAYPYEARTGECDQSKISPAVQNDGFVQLPRNNYTALMNAVATIGPVAISLAASSFDFQTYGGGVYDGFHCGFVQDHAVGLVGYGSSTRLEDYWIVRNSWGPTWGEFGYMLLRRFGEGREPCGEDRKPGDGDACAGDRKPRVLCGVCGVLSDSSYPTGVKVLNETGGLTTPP